MPHRELPNSNPTATFCLTTMRDKYVYTTNPAQRAIDATLFAQLDPAIPGNLANRYFQAGVDLGIAVSARTALTGPLSASADRLKMLVSHFHQVLDMGIVRGDFQPNARTYYGRDFNATSIPDLSNQSLVNAAAAQIAPGEIRRQTAEGASFIAMTLPNASDIEGTLADFAADSGLAGEADDLVNEKQEAQSALLGDVLPLCKDLCDAVEYFNRHDADPASFRAKCSEWGVSYIADTVPTPPVPPVTPP